MATDSRLPTHRRTPASGVGTTPNGKKRRRDLHRQEIVNVLFSFGWLTVHEIAFYSDLPTHRIRTLLESDDGLLADGTVSRRSRADVNGNVTRARTEYTVFPY